MKALEQNQIDNREELEELMDSVVSAKNRNYNRGGHAPAQFAFGKNPRLPQSLLSDDPMDEIGLQDLVQHFEDSAASAFQRSHEIRQAGFRSMMELDAK